MKTPQIPHSIVFDLDWILKQPIQYPFHDIKDALVDIAEADLQLTHPLWYDAEYTKFYPTHLVWEFETNEWENAITATLIPARNLAGAEFNIPPNYFRYNYGPLKGSDWLRTIPKQDRKALAHIANANSGYGSAGGEARARTAKRDSRGRFATNG